MAPANPASGGVFISYRRDDSAFAASYLYDRLSERFGADRVFKDVDSIPLGDDFVRAITEAVASCDCLIAVIGPRWLAASDDRGRRRIDLPNDYVRLELEAALHRDTRVVPVCTDGAAMPRAEELPASLEGFARRNALEVTATSIQADIRRLVLAVEPLIAGPPASPSAPTPRSEGRGDHSEAAPAPSEGPTRSRPRSDSAPTPGGSPWRPGSVLAVAVLLVVIALGVWWVVRGDEPPRETTVSVPGAQQWTPTGLTVTAGERILVEASGSINHDLTLTTGPEGIPNRPELLTLLPSANHAGLLGRVGDSPPVYLGADGAFVADRAGQLELGINDLGLENNGGAFTVVITTEGP